MDHTTIRASVYRDNTGVLMEIPVILTEGGPLQPLVDYLLECNRSFSWMQKMTQGVGLLLDYMAANHDCFDDSRELFRTFVQRLYSGTIGEDGTDPSGLYWLGMSQSLVRQLTNQLSQFSDWIAEKQGTSPINPWREATRYEERLNWAAWHQKHDRVFLAHTWDKQGASESAKRARSVLLKRNPVVDHEGVKRFPEDRIQDLLFKGFIVPGKQTSPRIEERLNLRDILITMLTDYGGLRMSEPFHLYVHDVQPDPLHPERAHVRVFHPSLGLAPNDWLDANGRPVRCNREAYLRGKHGLRPRDQYYSTDQLHAGWKGNALDSKAYFMHVHWFPTWSGEVFMKLWIFYMAKRAQKECDHPFAFVTEEGKPYSIDSFERAHRRAVERIGLTPAKALGTSPHGHRHDYGHRLTDAEIDPILLMKAFHHKSLESQVVYTEPDRVRLTRALDDATARLDRGRTLPPPDFASYGFTDVDPLGLLSGPNPRLRRT
ncbi:gamma-mobile-trio recombinase GmtY [Paraburkholderia oxyphila]|uniref:gamma-mobile-trio recombinase GmtY n=1 Tax=Paraburkholderia oxyphila TaxID=614212 RepID=UPI00048882DB|nr:gamma-mobile-trio recombinase GmtY [Paraburkholderia oxyphila]